MMVPSSISAPSTLVRMISAVSGSTTEKPKTPRNSAGQTGLLATTLSATVIRISTSGTGMKTSARLRPSVARRVIRSTTGLSRPDTGFTIVSLRRHQVREHALQRLIRRQHLAEPDVAVAAQPGELPRERAEVRSPDLQPARRQFHARHGAATHPPPPQRAVRRGPDQEHVRPAGHQPPDGAKVTRSCQPAADDHLDRAGHPLDFLEDVRAEQ